MPSLFPAHLDPDLRSAIEHGDPQGLQTLGSNNPAKLRGRDGAGRNLLDFTLFALQMNTIKNDHRPAHDPSPRRSIHALVTIGLHLLRQGLLPTPATLAAYLPTTYELANLRAKEACSESAVHDFEAFLVLVSAHEAPVSRALRLFAFAFWNPEHTAAVRRCYTAIVREQCFGQSLHELDAAVREYHARGDVFGPGAETVVFRAVLACHLPPDRHGDDWPDDAMAQLRPVRRLLLAMLQPVVPSPSRNVAPETVQEHVERSANLVRVCCELPLLGDGFGDAIAAFARREGTYDVWVAVMRRLGGGLGGGGGLGSSHGGESNEADLGLQMARSVAPLAVNERGFPFDEALESFVGPGYGFGSWLDVEDGRMDGETGATSIGSWFP